MHRFLFISLSSIIAISICTAGCFQPAPGGDLPSARPSVESSAPSSLDNSSSSPVVPTDADATEEQSDSNSVASDVNPDAQRTESPRAETDEELAMRMALATVRILDADRNLLGLGACIARHGDKFQVVTANHVVPDEGQVYVERRLRSEREDQSGIIYNMGPSMVLARDEARDLAVLEVISALAPGDEVTLGDAESAAEQESAYPLPATTIEWMPESKEPVLSQVAIVGSKRAARQAGLDAIEYWMVERKSQLGMSGGGIFDRQAHLLGIASGNSQGTAYFVHLSELRAFLDSIP